MKKELLYKTIFPVIIAGILSISSTWYEMNMKMKNAQGVSQEVVVELVKMIANKQKCEGETK